MASGLAKGPLCPGVPDELLPPLEPLFEKAPDALRLRRPPVSGAPLEPPAPLPLLIPYAEPLALRAPELTFAAPLAPLAALEDELAALPCGGLGTAAKLRFAEVMDVVGAAIDTDSPVMLMSEPMIWTPPAAPHAAIPPPIASMLMLCIAFIDTDMPLSVMPLRPLLLIDPGLLSEISDRLLTLVCPMLCREVPVVEVSRMLSALTRKLRASIDTVSEV